MKTNAQYIVERSPHTDEIRAIRCGHCVFAVVPRDYHKTGDKSGLQRTFLNIRILTMLSTRKPRIAEIITRLEARACGGHPDGVRQDELARDAVDCIYLLDADNIKLREALKPFADFAECVAKDRPGWDHDAFELFPTERLKGGPGITLEPFRRAASILGERG